MKTDMKKLFYLSALTIAFLSGPQALATSQSNVQTNLKNMFTVAAQPYVAEAMMSRAAQKYVDMKVGTHIEADLDYCLEAKFPYNVFGSDYAKHLIHSSEPRCTKFFPAAWQGLGVGDMSEKNYLDSAITYNVADEVNRRFTLKTDLTALSLLRLAKEKMQNPSRNHSLSATEVCAAVALGDVAAQAIQDIANSGCTPDETAQGCVDPEHAVSYVVGIYQKRIEYVAMSVSDWIAKTNGNSTICPNFGLELQVSELSERVERAEDNLVTLIPRVDGLEAQMKAVQREQFITTSAFWGLGFLGYKLLTPL